MKQGDDEKMKFKTFTILFTILEIVYFISGFKFKGIERAIFLFPIVPFAIIFINALIYETRLRNEMEICALINQCDKPKGQYK